MDVPVQKVDETIKTGKESFVTLRFDVLDPLKCTGGLKSVEAVYRSGAGSYTPAPKSVLAPEWQRGSGLYSRQIYRPGERRDPPV